ncbi:MAG: hexokinase [Treponema sp.]|nr:hexokinase [Treponema sp.]
MIEAVSDFFSRHNFVRHVAIETTVDALLHDMQNGLHGKASDQDMIRTFINPPEKSPCGKSVIVIDAGGTNFRSCLVTFDEAGMPSIDLLQKTSMPGVGTQLSRTEFFDAIAKNIEHLKDKADAIGFCFSYAMKITEDGDGTLIMFSKEVNAPEVIGSKIGACLQEALARHGWKKNVRITLLNDTVAALLAGAAAPAAGKKYSSYIGLILGTGLNAAYIQSKIDSAAARANPSGFEKQIIVCESGKFSHIALSDFDKAADGKTLNQKTYLIEKQSSGAYLGAVAHEVLVAAANEKLLSEQCAHRIAALQSLSLIEFDSFLHAPFLAHSTIGTIAAECATARDYDILFELLDSVAERSARHAAAVLAACVIQSGAGTSASKPVCIVCNGSTYYKTHGIARRVQGYLEEVLTAERGLYWETISVEHDITLGAAIGGLARL